MITRSARRAKKRVRFREDLTLNDTPLNQPDSYTILILNTSVFTISRSVRDSWRRCQTFLLHDDLVRATAAEQVLNKHNGYIHLDVSTGFSSLTSQLDKDLYKWLEATKCIDTVFTSDDDSDITEGDTTDTDEENSPKHTKRHTATKPTSKPQAKPKPRATLLHDDDTIGASRGITQSLFARVLIIHLFTAI